ncbi:ArsR family transcriptional regulator [Halorubrum sp. 48-1-W]|uniref:ArsR family transcriptional regulator n=1 Tax=Halorubrum sp. 48-1-W TaxID=2249761 RepID=UPI000DCBDF53|nr:ArsR family transcriptional regulator [Halorubrum sp. 48-1-W]RAW45651.1 ArsR family transcriptional regulator [Halorubrum sp. 48-1-W]
MNEQLSSPAFDSHLDALGHVARRRLLLALLDTSSADDGAVEFDRLASDSAEGDPLLSMRHRHLPKLEEHGFIDVDPDSRSVSKGPHFEEIRPLLELLDENGDRLPADWV